MITSPCPMTCLSPAGQRFELTARGKLHSVTVSTTTPLKDWVIRDIRPHQSRATVVMITGTCLPLFTRQRTAGAGTSDRRPTARCPGMTIRHHAADFREMLHGVKTVS